MIDLKHPMWAKCQNETCGHCWPCAYLPMEMPTAAELMGKARCPMCGHKRPTIAKQDNGLLKEQPGTGPAVAGAIGRMRICATIGRLRAGANNPANSDAEREWLECCAKDLEQAIGEIGAAHGA